MIGWVGLVITAHGPAHLRLRLPLAHARLHAGQGGIFLLIVDNLSRNISTSGIPIGIPHGLRRRALLPPAHNGKG